MEGDKNLEYLVLVAMRLAERAPCNHPESLYRHKSTATKLNKFQSSSDRMFIGHVLEKLAGRNWRNFGSLEIRLGKTAQSHRHIADG